MDLKILMEDLEYELLQGSLETPVASVEYDSRKVQPGSLFVAIKGYETDGHLYIGKALEQGAAAIILEDLALAVLCKSSADQGVVLENFQGNDFAAKSGASAITLEHRAHDTQAFADVAFEFVA